MTSFRRASGRPINSSTPDRDEPIQLESPSLIESEANVMPRSWSREREPKPRANARTCCCSLGGDEGADGRPDEADVGTPGTT